MASCVTDDGRPEKFYDIIMIIWYDTMFTFKPLGRNCLNDFMPQRHLEQEI